MPVPPAAAPPATPAPLIWLRPQEVRALRGGLDAVPLLNDNNPELIQAPGVLLSTFPTPAGRSPQVHLDRSLSGRFDLFSHHVVKGLAEQPQATLWLGVVASSRRATPVTLRLLAGSTALSQSSDPAQPSAPFLPLPGLMPQEDAMVFSGPGSRVAAELLAKVTTAIAPSGPLPAGPWILQPGAPTVLMALPIPVRHLVPPLNGRNLQLRFDSDGPVSVATLAQFGGDQAPDPASWQTLLAGPLSPKEHAASPRGAAGPLIYSRVSGVQRGSLWRAVLSDPGQQDLAVPAAPISWPISSLERGRLGSGQVQSAELSAFYPGTAWAAHGNYGVEYDLTLPLVNRSQRPAQLALSLDSPLKSDTAIGGLRFRSKPGPLVTFRGTVIVQGLDADAGPGAGPQRAFHLQLLQGEAGPALGLVNLAPGERRRLRLRLLYPADATPPQVLTLSPLLAARPAPQPAPIPAPLPSNRSPQPGARL